jgi:short-subunit dehydrogenase involved in D-alanine esterification of teichoic acids
MKRLEILKEQISQNKEGKLKGKTVVITGGSRGIGLAIGIRCAQDGANVAILAKTVTAQPTLPGIILNMKELFILQLRILLRLAEKDFLLLVIFVMNKA